MHRHLIIKAFEKAKRETLTDKKTRIAKHLSDYIFEETGEMYGEKSLRTHFTNASENAAENIEFKAYVANALCKYLGYNDFSHFLRENTVEVKESRSHFMSNINGKKKVLSSMVIAVLIGFFGYNTLKKDCMVWQDGHYVKVNCNKEDHDKSVQYDKLIFESQKQIYPDCNYPFFKTDGRENLWYGKSAEGKLEFFTYYGLHPVNGKTLNPITQYMIKKYICK
ncbi:MAG: hypothetical protein RQ735_11195 [Flavobacteriaceae bacterium]|nr:hypothetical protein [Flavobacteriaceae bacterium]